MDKSSVSMNEVLQWAIKHSDGPAVPANQLSDSDRAALSAALETDVERMRKALDVIKDPSVDKEGKEIALDDLLLLVDSIDSANDLPKIGGLPVLLTAAASPDLPSLRSGALWVLGTAAQNNPEFQKAFSSHEPDAWPLLLQTLRQDTDAGVRRKAIFAISALLRQNPAVSEICQRHGVVDALAAVLADAAAPDQLVAKVLFALSRLLHEAPATAPMIIGNERVWTGVHTIATRAGTLDPSVLETEVKAVAAMLEHPSAADAAHGLATTWLAVIAALGVRLDAADDMLEEDKAELRQMLQLAKSRFVMRT